MIVTVTDIRRAGFCPVGIRRWFLDHGWTNADFREFLANGMDHEELLQKGDHLAQLVVDRKREREAKDGR